MVHVNYWLITNTSTNPIYTTLDTIKSDTISSDIISFVVSNSQGVGNGYELIPIFDNNPIESFSINRKFYVAPAILDSTVVGGKSVNSKMLKLSDFKVISDITNGADSARYNNIEWYRNGASVQSGMDTTYLADVSGEYSIKVSVLYKTRQYISPDSTSYGNDNRDYYSNKLIIDITSSSTVIFNVVGGNGTLDATVDGITIASNETVTDNKDVVFTATPATNYVVKQWMVNDTIVEGNTTNNFTLNILGNNVTVTVEFELVDGIIEEIKNNIIQVYPIPTKDYLNISEEIEYVVFSIIGQEMLKGFGNRIDVSTFNKGVYILKTNGGNKRFIVE